MGRVKRPVTSPAGLDAGGSISESGWKMGLKTRQKPKLRSVGEKIGRANSEGGRGKDMVGDKGIGSPTVRSKKTDKPIAETEMDYLTNVKARARRSMKGKQPPE